jgi:hypothetical protein
MALEAIASRQSVVEQRLWICMYQKLAMRKSSRDDALRFALARDVWRGQPVRQGGCRGKDERGAVLQI